MNRRKLLVTMVAWLAVTTAAASAAWEPGKFREASTLEYLTVGPEEGEHWSRVWVVVIDEQPYLRLGARAAGRMEGNAKRPFVKIRLGDELFERVRAEPAPDMAERVAAAMGEKYPSDVVIRHFPHPLTVRLVLDPEAK